MTRYLMPWIVVAMNAVLCAPALAVPLLGKSAGSVFTIDSVTLATAPRGSMPAASPDLELNPDGTVVYQAEGSDLVGYSTSSFTEVSRVSLSGFPTGTPVGDHGTLTSMEFVGAVLYASTARSGPENGQSALVTVNLDSGAMTILGFSGRPHWTTGMALDPGTGVLHGVTGTDNGNSQFFTINLADGSTSNVMQLTFGGNQTEAATSLVLASDNQLYLTFNSGLGGVSRNALYTVDRGTGSVSLVGDLGRNFTALTNQPFLAPTNVPATGDWALLIVALLVPVLAWRGLARSR